MPIAVFEDPGQAGTVDVYAMLDWLQGWTVFSERPVRGRASDQPESSGRPNSKIIALGPLSSEVRHHKVLLVRHGRGHTISCHRG